MLASFVFELRKFTFFFIFANDLKLLFQLIFYYKTFFAYAL